MQSLTRLGLKIKDSKIEKLYTESHTSNVLICLVVLCILRVFWAIYLTIFTTKIEPTLFKNGLTSTIYFGWIILAAQLLLIPLNWKFPKYLNKYSVIVWLTLTFIGIGPDKN
jgi:hypothetical protein